MENDLRAALTAQTICASRKGLRISKQCPPFFLNPFTPNTGRGEEVLKKIPNIVCKILRNQKYPAKALSKRFHLNGKNIGFFPLDLKFRVTHHLTITSDRGKRI